tara:strand:- start:86 stop:1879 length:1794 start_codon:yes stop_codon:yes gene_type:complete
LLDINQIDISNIVENWLIDFNEIIQNSKSIDDKKITKIFSKAFHKNSHWRDLIALTWEIITYSDIENIQKEFLNSLSKQNVSKFSIDKNRTKPRKVKRGGNTTIEAILSFSTKNGIGESVVRLTEEKENNGIYKCWSIMTSLSSMGKSEDSNINKVEKIKNFKAPNWLDIRNFEKTYENKQPDVLVVGAGQAGLSIAARLKQLKVDTLIVDKNERIGDNWRNRYHSLTLHNQTHVNHLPYMPFPETWPTYIPKDKLAGWFEYYAESMELNVWQNTQFIKANYNKEKKGWIVETKVSNGKIKYLYPKHIVMAVGVSSVPQMPKIEGLDNFSGKIIHSAEHKTGQSFKDKNVLVFGTGTSAHDVCQDLYANDANVTMVQRSPTMIVNLEPSAQLPYALYQEGPNTNDCDLIAISSPLSVLKKTHQMFTKQSKKLDEVLLNNLKKIGFVLDYGEDNTGWQFKYLTRGGGYYFNVGASNLIADKKIRLIQYKDIREFTKNGIIHNSYGKRNFDAFIFATGYKGQEYMVEKFFGEEVAKKVGKIWDFNQKTQELNNMFVKTNQDGLWFIAGSLAQCRIFSKYLSFQIKAEIKKNKNIFLKTN